jgi:hypothetical protein
MSFLRWLMQWVDAEPDEQTPKLDLNKVAELRYRAHTAVRTAG